MNVDIIIQARMTSTRLPGKILLPVLDKPLLWYQIERLRRVKSARQIIIATTENETDEPIVEFCQTMGLPYYRGSEDDVLARYYHAATKFNCKNIVRITSDCPVIDPMVVDQLIDFYLEHRKSVDYVSNFIDRTYPRGMDSEIFSYQTLYQVFGIATERPDREHVTAFIYRNPDRFRLGSITDITDNSRYRLTVDTVEDYELLKRIIEALYPSNPYFSVNDIKELMTRNPKWFLINSHIEQKQYGQ